MPKKDEEIIKKEKEVEVVEKAIWGTTEDFVVEGGNSAEAQENFNQLKKDHDKKNR